MIPLNSLVVLHFFFLTVVNIYNFSHMLFFQLCSKLKLKLYICCRYMKCIQSYKNIWNNNQWFTFEACNLSSLFAFFPIQTKMCVMVSKTNTSPSLNSFHDMVGSWRMTGCLLPLTMNSLGDLAVSTWDSPVATPPCNTLDIKSKFIHYLKPDQVCIKNLTTVLIGKVSNLSYIIYTQIIIKQMCLSRLFNNFFSITNQEKLFRHTFLGNNA